MIHENYRLTATERLLPFAIKAVEKYIEKDKKVPKAFKGYISSFGAGVVMSGLLPTIAIYSERKTNVNDPKENRSEQDRSLVLDALWAIIKEGKEGEIDKKQKHPILIKAVEENNSNHHRQRLFLEQVNQAAIALKHALRTFEIDKSKNE